MLHLLLVSLTLSAAPVDLRTVAEKTDYIETGRYAEVEKLCDAFQTNFKGKVACRSFGETPQGRKMWYLAASDNGALTPAQCIAKKRPVVFFHGGIHAGEIDGKDAGFRFVREALEGKWGDVLSQVTLVFVPVFNVDGHERFGQNNRPNQRGPKEMGWRVTAQNYNLNRDYMKADTVEMAAMLSLLHAFDPLVYLDLHVTDGAKFQHEIALLFEPSLIGDATMKKVSNALSQDVLAQLREKKWHPLDFYPSFRKEDDPTSGFARGVPPPRFSQRYWALNNRIGVLVETHSWHDYKTRVQATFDTLAAVSQLVAKNGKAWLATAHALDHSAAEVEAPAELTFSETGAKHEIEFLGYETKYKNSEVSGQRWVQYDENAPKIFKVPLFDEVAPVLVIVPPTGGYVVPVAHAKWVAEKLRLHHVEFKVLNDKRDNLDGQAFKADVVEFRSQSYEGRQSVKLKGTWKAQKVSIEKGALFIPMHQARRLLAINLLEPEAPDSLAAWGFFNAHFEQREYMENYVAEEVARDMLKDSKVKAEFEQKLKDPEFLKSPDARLQFFYAKHPSFDSSFQVYPITRVQNAL